MISDCFQEYGVAIEPSQTYAMHLQVDDLDAAWQRAVAAGATVTMPIELMCWGDRYGKLRDPFGINWALPAAGEPAA